MMWSAGEQVVDKLCGSRHGAARGAGGSGHLVVGRAGVRAGGIRRAARRLLPVPSVRAAWASAVPLGCRRGVERARAVYGLLPPCKVTALSGGEKRLPYIRPLVGSLLRPGPLWGPRHRWRIGLAILDRSRIFVRLTGAGLASVPDLDHRCSKGGAWRRLLPGCRRDRARQRLRRRSAPGSACRARASPTRCGRACARARPRRRCAGAAGAGARSSHRARPRGAACCARRG